MATNEWRMVIVEPALFYLLLRGVKLKEREMWVVLDAFVMSGLALALFGLWQFVFDPDSLITAEGGLLRVRAIFGSPNNLALYLGRILPLLFAMLLLGQANGNRRWLYSLFLIPMGLATLLTFSKGALILGLPVAFLYIFWRWQQVNWPFYLALAHFVWRPGSGGVCPRLANPANRRTHRSPQPDQFLPSASVAGQPQHGQRKALVWRGARQFPLCLSGALYPGRRLAGAKSEPSTQYFPGFCHAAGHIGSHHRRLAVLGSRQTIMAQS
ncbi:MAG: hypothetical protein M5U34_13295 [Chloroflexi bacterium]|nr:hypothetical protein [Chloroflexota bacterium]